MAKLTKQQKIEIYEKRKSGFTILKLCQQYGINRTNIEYLIRLIDMHGPEILRNDKNRHYSKELKEEIINEVLTHGNSVNSTSLKFGLPSSGMLRKWIKSYKENGYNVVEKPKGRPITMKRNEKTVDPNDKDAIIRQKDKEIEYLQAEVAYLKKLRAVVQERTDRQSRKK